MARARFSIGGIDLGTTNSALAFVSLVGDATPEILLIPQWEGLAGLTEQPTLPSFLSLPEDAVAAHFRGGAAGDGQWIIGRFSRTKAGETPGRVVSGILCLVCRKVTAISTANFDSSRPGVGITWPNGAVASIYNATEPEQLRGPEHAAACCDELCKWQYQQETWDQLAFGLRSGAHPQMCITTTPRPTRLLKAIMADPRTIVTRGSTFDNRSNLASSFLEAPNANTTELA